MTYEHCEIVSPLLLDKFEGVLIWKRTGRACLERRISASQTRSCGRTIRRLSNGDCTTLKIPDLPVSVKKISIIARTSLEDGMTQMPGEFKFMGEAAMFEGCGDGIRDTRTLFACAIAGFS